MKLAIKGHATRGEEVIQLLEMLGADRLGYKDTFVGFYYYIECGAIVSTDEYPIDDAIVFTLEEFEEKHPYKVGDFVKVPKYGLKVQIDSIVWNGYEINYKTRTAEPEWYTVEELNMWNIKENINKTKTPRTHEEVKEYLLKNSVKNAHNLLVIEKCLNNDGMELPDNAKIHRLGIGSIEFIKWYEAGNKPTCPKTYDECCEVLGFASDNGFGFLNLREDEKLLISNFIKLKRCRDAYWKIAGEQMGLGKSWKPQFENCNILHYCIFITHTGKVCKYCFYGCRCILAFPTEEMRDAFYENFKELIESCKELL